ncbi:MAG: ABC transporter ATP-binding protein [Sulfuricurvum sp.]|nr:ABC transporter ATP-binding protein [Sulfuricurvum sp.]
MNLKIDHLHTDYLNDISFELNDENVVILGSNGAGKTTLAKAIVNLAENDRVSCNTKKVSEMSAKDRSQLLNFIPSKLEVFDEYIDVREFLELSLLNGTAEKEIERVLSLLEITHLENKSCKEISSGESQLVLFAGGLLQNSELTLFDEPTANLDSDKKIKIFELLKHTQSLKMVITHDLNLAFRLGFRVLFLQNGTIAYDGSCEEFFAQENLYWLFGDSIKRVDDFFMVNYR